ncbi:MAG TPA: DUF4142 domain-containing protein [Sphingomicrobium sp.]
MVRSVQLLLGCALFALAACQPRDDTSTDNNIENGVENVSTDPATGDAAAAPAAADFAAAVARSDLYEIESGELAAQKATSAEVKSFAQMLVGDHRKSTADLKAAVAGIDPPVTIEPVLDQEKLGMVETLKSTPAADFDKAFIDQQKQAHQKALELLRAYAARGDNQALKDFAAKASTVVQGHLDKLNGMQP